MVNSIYMLKKTLTRKKTKPRFKIQTFVLKLKEFELTLNLNQKLTKNQTMKIEKQINSIAKKYLKYPQFEKIQIQQN